MREIRGIGLIPSGGRGGGIASAHLNHEHAAAVILSLAAPTPGGAVAAYNAVKDLDRDNVQAGDFAGLGFTLATTIQTTASSILAGQKPFEHPEANKWELTICLDPVTVWQSWIVDGTERREGFSDRQSVLPRPVHPQDVHRGIRRQTIITSSVLNVAAELVADTFKREVLKPEKNKSGEWEWVAQAEKRQAIFNEYDALVANADQEAGQSADTQSQPGLPMSTPENETAATLAGEAAAVCAQSDETEVVGSLQPHLKRERKFPQATVLLAGHSITERNVTNEHDRHGSINLSPA